MPISDFEGDWTAHRDQIYGILRSSFIDDNGDSTFPTDDARIDNAPNVSVFQALLWAIATGLGQAQEQLERAASNANPSQAQELLGLLERDYQVIPDYDSSITERQAALVLRARVARGASRAAIEAALTELLGSDFISYDTNDDPANLVTFPSVPGSVGIFETEAVERKIFRILDPITKLGTAVTVRYEVIGDSSAPIAGETYCFDPDPRRRIENVTILATSEANGVKRLTAQFTHAHDRKTFACRPIPVWVSTQRHSRIVLSHAAATNEKVRARVHDYLSRALRGVSTWFIASDAGALLLDSPTRGLLDCSPFTTTATAPVSTSQYASAVAVALTGVSSVGSLSMPGASVGSIAATTTVSGASGKTANAAATAAGASTASATSNAQKRSAGSAASVSFNAAFSLRGPIGSASAASAASATSAWTAAAAGTASCVAAASGVGAAKGAATAAATAASATACVGSARSAAVGSSSTTSTGSGVGSP